jgi:hypothetical protein
MPHVDERIVVPRGRPQMFGSTVTKAEPPLNAHLLSFPEPPRVAMIWAPPTPRFGIAQQLETSE